MVEWTEAERRAIESVWEKIDINVIGPQALESVLIVYPWTQRYFGAFGNLSSVSAITGNPKVAIHGKIVLKSLGLGVKNLDDIKNTYAKLSELHSEKLNVDPDNFRLLADCITIVISTKLGPAFPPEVQAAWQKFLDVVVSALSREYH
ncbi:hemoglobin cathodic subunit beta-like [Brienomyrus brachyistius]|uniref:hemoglobin cathodic subunit beta-like n=1 Tax=Brienomyrus brachyistius TaxID=42636 RepID=UPI0020B3F2F2|nr:hemoglobin cathodic subunit beta-like [Brienomyrus brachyistius]